MKRLFVSAIALFFLSTGVSQAQNYDWAAGIRAGGETIGLSVKHNFNATHGLEVIVAYPWRNGFTVTGLYQRHVPVISDGFQFYYGGGAHIGSWDHRFSIGVDAVAGLEYRLAAAPIAFSVDYKPAFNIASRTRFYMLDFAAGIKYCF